MKIWDTNVNLVHFAGLRNQDPQIYVDHMKQAGFGAAFRYLRRSASDRTGLTSDEVALYHRNNIRVGLIFQHRSNAPHLFTDANGTADGQAAIDRAQELGVPVAVPIFFAHDTDMLQTHQPNILAYLAAVGRKVKPVGRIVMVYGDSEVINYATATAHPDPDMGDLADGGMLTNAKGWSGDKRIFQSDNPKVLVRQTSLPVAPYLNAPFQVDIGEVHDSLVEVVTW